MAAVVLDDALIGVDQDDEGRVEHGEDQIECQANEEELPDWRSWPGPSSGSKDTM